jgi:hypothetical protein
LPFSVSQRADANKENERSALNKTDDAGALPYWRLNYELYSIVGWQ